MKKYSTTFDESVNSIQLTRMVDQEINQFLTKEDCLTQKNLRRLETELGSRLKTQLSTSPLQKTRNDSIKLPHLSKSQVLSGRAKDGKISV